MKFILTLLFPLIWRIIIYEQVITYDDFKTLIPFLQKGDFKSTFQKNKLLSSTQNNSSDLRGIVTDMNIFSAAGMALEQMTYEDFKINSNKYIGQLIVMSLHPCIDSSAQGFNCLKFVTQDG
jgi:hypothetical protein